MKEEAPPDDYVKCVKAMSEAATQWMRTHPFAGPFQFKDIEGEYARRVGFPGEKAGIAAPLDTVIDDWAANEDTRSFLCALVEAGKPYGTATYMQAKFLISQAIENMLERGQGQVPGGGWECTGCGAVQDGYTKIDGDGEPPRPGAIGVCWNCGVIQQVNAAGNGFDPLPTREFNKLPKSLRKVALSMRAGVLERLAKKKKERTNLS